MMTMVDNDDNDDDDDDDDDDDNDDEIACMGTKITVGSSRYVHMDGWMDGCMDRSESNSKIRLMVRIYCTVVDVESCY